MSDPVAPPSPTPVAIPFDGLLLEGDLALPRDAAGVVLFAHGSGSGRLSPRNRFVASVLQQARLGTLLLDLLTADEERAEARTGHLRFDIALLATRLGAATEWLRRAPETRHLRIGYFGASTGAAAALVAAAERSGVVRAVVSRGGRPDLAERALPLVSAPTLLVVGGADAEVLELNRRALRELRCDKRLVVVPGATHLFEEPGALEQVAELATAWFARHVAVAPAPARGTSAW